MTTPRAATTSLVVAAVLAIFLAVPAAAAEPAAVRNLTAQFAGNGFAVERLQAFEVGGVLILRGRTLDRSAAEAVGIYAQVLGFQRVANLIQVQESPDDQMIRRAAERELAMHRALDGSRISVQSQEGVITLRGRVRDDAHRDMAMAVLRSVDGVREVRAELERD
jgi:osmotically-inducible protein OsmY